MGAVVIICVAIAVLSGSSVAAVPVRLSASIPPLATIARDVGGVDVEISTILPPGATPHHFEPGPEVVRAVSAVEAHLVVGLGLDPWAEDLARAVNPEAPIVQLGRDLSGEDGEPDGAHAHNGSHGHPVGDPHVWMDPLEAATMAERIGDLLGRLRPKMAKQHRLRAAEVAEGYRSLYREWEERLEPVRDVGFVTYHGGLSHLAARFGLRQVAVLAEFPGQEPSPRDLKRIIEQIEGTHARAIFSEPQSASSLAEVVGLETGIPVTRIDVLGGTEDGMTYERLLRDCLETMLEALLPGDGESR